MCWTYCDKNFYHFQGVLVGKDKKFFQGHSRLAEEREKLWATQQEAADFFEISRVTWGQCERGNATPSGEVLAGLAQRGADVLYILTGQRSSVEPALTADERELLGLFRSATLTGKAAAIGALQGAAGAGAPAPKINIAGGVSGQVADVIHNTTHVPIKSKAPRQRRVAGGG